MRTGCQNDLIRPNTPEALAKPLALIQRQVIGQRLTNGQKVVVMVAKDHAAPDNFHLGHSCQLGLGSAHPVKY